MEQCSMGELRFFSLPKIFFFLPYVLFSFVLERSRWVFILRNYDEF